MNPVGVSGNIFESTSNQAANGFQNPMSMAHLYPGWGVDPNMQTPAYDAPYRPAYRGPNPYAAYQKPTFMGGISQLYNPFYTSPYWGNPVDNNRNAFSSVSSKPMDTAAYISQGFIAPAIAYGVTQAMFRGAGRALGRGFGTSLATGLGLGGIAGGVGAIAGFAGSFAIPYAIGSGVMHAVEKGIFQPYIRSRQMSDHISDSFAGVTFSDGGNVISGRGLSGRESSRLAGSIDRRGMNDMTFSANQYGGIASMGMRAGLFDDVNGTSDILKRVGSIATQIKSIIAISKDPNIQSAIEELAKLRLGGASISGGIASQAMSAYSAIGMHASAAGTSVQRIMSTVGNQGQYMFQMNGITPYLGQISAASAYSGFASAQRLGLMSTAQFARMGGLEGATQSALGAQISGSSTLYNRMSLMNQFMGGGRQNGVTANVSAFGEYASRDPLATMGSMGLYGNAMISRQMAGPGGVKALENQAIDMARAIGRDGGKDGYDPSVIAGIMQAQGIPMEQIQAYAALRASQTNPDLVGQNIRAYRAQSREQIMQYIDQEMLWAGPLGSTVASATRGLKRGYSRVADNTGHAWNRMKGSFNDAIERTWSGFQYGSTIGDTLTGTDKINMDGVRKGIISSLKEKAGPFAFRNGNTQASNTQEYKIISALEEASRGNEVNSELARSILKAGVDTPEGKKLLAKFLQTSDNPDLKDAGDSLDSSTAVLDKVSAALKGNIIKGEKIDAKTSTIWDQASQVWQAGEGSLAVNFDDIMKGEGQYKELKAAMKGMSRSEQIAQVRKYSEDKIRSRGHSVQEGASATSMIGYLNRIETEENTIKGARENSSSDVNWKLFSDTMNKLDTSSDALLQAAHILAGSKGKDIVLKQQKAGAINTGFNTTYQKNFTVN